MATCHDFDPGLGANSARSSGTSQSTANLFPACVRSCGLLRCPTRCWYTPLGLSAATATTLRVHASAQRIHEIDHFRRRTLSWHFDRIFVMILELLRLGVARLGLDDMGGEFQHVLWNFFVGDFSLAARGKQSNSTIRNRARQSGSTPPAERRPRIGFRPTGRVPRRRWNPE